MKIFKLTKSDDAWGHINYIKHQCGAYHIPFEGDDNIYDDMVLDIENTELPNEFCFGADYNIIPKFDFPANSLMLHIFTSLTNIKYRTVPVVMYNHKELEAYHIEEGIGLDDLKERNDDYLALQLLEYTNVLDLDRSIYEEHFLYPGKVGSIRKLALKRPEKEFPSIFKIEEDSTLLFVTEQAKNALEAFDIKGCIFEGIEVSE